jgi:hypothetical protein
LWSISTVRGWSILADHFQSHGLNSLSLSLSLSLLFLTTLYSLNNTGGKQ